ncbi:DUF805 domain-containing protein [Membranihabitans marinus]|uniref:DUF805 domain-containing protein n=1 Tax=Membranihabitans marinus TaxID=1227546 RepID=UPI001F3A8CD6|nr:DUF805 domain-containing protein [Membranihabitans marinus]
MEWYFKVLRQYNDFNGRARRQEFWMFALINMILSMGATMVDYIFELILPFGLSGPIASLYSLFVLIPTIAVAVRRLHDIGKSGWMLLVALIPFIGFIWLIVLFVREGEPQENRYGYDPKEQLI